MRRGIVVIGASGYTGRFVVSALCKRGRNPILVGRNAATLRAAFPKADDANLRTASVEDAASLDRAMDGAALVVNCAGPFLDSASPVIEACLRNGVHYLDITAEQEAARLVFERFDAPARKAGLVIAPAVGFYGGLADLLATALVTESAAIRQIDIAVALDSWQPTAGTRRTGKRNTFPRYEIFGGEKVLLSDPPPQRIWGFPPPFGAQDMVGLPFSEIATISRHLRLSEIRSFMNVSPLKDIRDPHTPPPVPDADGYSPQRFMMDVIGAGAAKQSRATAWGRDIYAATAPIVVEAADQILQGKGKTHGAVALGALFEPLGFLQALQSPYFSFEIRGPSPIKAA